MKKINLLTPSTILLSLLLFLVLAPSCRNDDDGGGTTIEEPEPEPEPEPEALKADFQPTTLNSTWDYHSDDDYSITISTASEEEDTIFYEMYNPSKGEVFATGKIVNGDYYGNGFIRLPGVPAIEILYFKDYLGVDEEWSQDLEINGIEGRIKFRIAATGLSHTIEETGETYQDVTQVGVSLLVKIAEGLYGPFVDEHFHYHAKNIGLLYMEFPIGNENEDIYLLDYNIAE